MRRYFNTEGVCEPDIHYMVNLDERLRKIKSLYVDRGKYFVINKGRQYGKTTTLRALAEYLGDDYLVASMDFQGIGTEDFANAQTFVNAFAKSFMAAIKRNLETDGKLLHSLREFTDHSIDKSLRELFYRLSQICAEAPKPVVLLIDEVDSASNNQVFIDFLAQLRQYYLARKNSPIFHSVILAGVYDIKNLKLKIRPDHEHQYNSPWNIAAKFNLDMSFSAEQIAAMLREYEGDSHTGMDTGQIAQGIYDYTSGYPYLVSAVCKILDEEIPGSAGFPDLSDAWTLEGVAEAVKIILKEKTPLFGSMMRQMSEDPELKRILKAIVFQGRRISYNPGLREIDLAAMFGYIKDSSGSVQIANRIFETLLCNLFLSEEELTEAIYGRSQGNISQFIQNGRLDMDLVLAKFVEYFTEIYGGNTEKFLEENGRRLFLLYLKPIINGTGNYYLEAQTRDARRTDVVVDYLGEQFVVELKIWHGNEYNERGEKQLAEYLDYFHLKKGYMLSFNFNQKKESGMKEIAVGDKVIVEAVV